MVTYTCPRCHYTTDHKTKFTRHQNRKNKCKIIPNNTTTSYFTLGHPAGHPMGHPDDQPDDQKDDQKNRVIRMTAKSYPKNTPNEDVLLENVKSQYQNFNNLSCRYCNEMFTQKQKVRQIRDFQAQRADLGPGGAPPTRDWDREGSCKMFNFRQVL